jgi:hypothetical protein
MFRASNPIEREAQHSAKHAFVKLCDEAVRRGRRAHDEEFGSPAFRGITGTTHRESIN